MQEMKKRKGKFWERVNKTDTCWLWQGAIKNNGYGHTTYHQKQTNAHRLSWMLLRGEIPEGLEVCHKCDVRLCVNPDHLFLATHEENIRDCWAKGRMKTPTPQRSKLTLEQLNTIRTGPLSASKIARVIGISSSYAKRIRAGSINPVACDADWR